MIINNQPQTNLSSSVESTVSNTSNQPSTNTNGSAASNVLEFAASASNPQFASAPDTHSSLNVLLNNLRQLLSSFIQPAGQGAPSQASTAQAPATNTSNEVSGVQANSGDNYANSLSDFEFSNMTSQEEIRSIVSSTDTLTRGDNRLTFRPESIPAGASAAQRSRINNANTEDLKASLQLAADTGIPLTISGRVTITEPLEIVPTENLTVNATNGVFVAGEGLDGDMIRIIASSTATGVDVDWNGGTFDISGAQTALNASPHQGEFLRNSNPDAEMRRRIEQRRGTSETTDGLSIIGVNRGNQNQGIETANIDNVRFISLPVEDLNADFDDLELSDPVRDSWREAGGDSAIFLQGLNEANVTNSEFFGSRDAAVYFSASPPVLFDRNGNRVTDTNRDGTIDLRDVPANQRSQAEFRQSGSNYSATGNTISNAFDGLTSKRGADSINFSNNTLTDVVIGLSTKETAANTRANNVTFDNNTITRSSRGILLEDSSDVTITNNRINELGRQVAGDESIRNSTTSRRAEGIALEGVVGDIAISGNTINRSNSDGSVPLANSSNVVGIVLDDFDSSLGPDAKGEDLDQQERNRIVSGNTFNGFSNNRDRLRNEVEVEME